MKTSKILPILFTYLMFFSCQREESIVPNSDIEHLIFGIDYAECMGDCANLYKLSANQLLSDQVNHITPDYTNLQFNDTPLPEDKYRKANRLLASVPQELLEAEEEKFGQPNAHDQGGITIGLKIRGEEVRYWYIDTIEGRLPDYLVPYIQEVKVVLEELR